MSEEPTKQTDKPPHQRPVITTGAAFVLMLPLVVLLWWIGLLLFSFQNKSSDLHIKISPTQGIDWDIKTNEDHAH